MNDICKEILKKRLKFCLERLKEFNEYDKELVDRMLENRQTMKEWNEEINCIYQEIPELNESIKNDILYER